jgi:hypothetical protein
MDTFDLRAYLKENKLKQESVEFNKVEDTNDFDDIPSIKMQIIDDNSLQSPMAFFEISAMYHDGSNGKMEILKNNKELQEEVLNTLQKELQNTFRRVIHGILGEPYGLPESKKK